MGQRYFAYGSNMSIRQMKERCPNSRKVEIARIENYSLCFPRHSKSRNCGVASIKSDAGQTVWGVVFELSEDDVAKLNRSEGYNPQREASKNSYNRIDVELVGSDDSPLDRCFTYVANPQTGIFRPSHDYLSTIISGAEENSLPEIYLAGLAAIEFSESE